LVACGGGSTGFKFEDASSAREPGKVWEAKNNWKLADETKGAVKGGIYRGYASGDQDGHYDAIVLMSSQTPTSAHIHEMLMAKTAGPGIDPASLDAAQPTGALAESWEFSPDYLRITFTMRQGVKFHNVAPVNGRVMDMDDWRTSQERHFASGVYKAAIGDVLDGIEFPDARHMVWKLKAPFAPIVDYIYHDKSAFPILPKELNANPSLAERTPIGRLQDPRQVPAGDRLRVPQEPGLLGRRAIHRPLARADHPGVRQPLRAVRERQHPALLADAAGCPADEPGRAGRRDHRQPDPVAAGFSLPLRPDQPEAAGVE
jgi:hypothetical protein